METSYGTSEWMLRAICDVGCHAFVEPINERPKLLKLEEIYICKVDAYVFKTFNGNGPCVCEYSNQIPT